MTSRSVGGITIGNSWLRNNPDILYPAGHESMDDATLMEALRSEHTEHTEHDEQISDEEIMTNDIIFVNQE